MFRFRWLKSDSITQPSQSSFWEPHGGFWMTLQISYLLMYQHATGAVGPSGDGWSEWQNVPVQHA